jgi:hypothetical protein
VLSAKASDEVTGWYQANRMRSEAFDCANTLLGSDGYWPSLEPRERCSGRPKPT